MTYHHSSVQLPIRSPAIAQMVRWEYVTTGRSAAKYLLSLVLLLVFLIASQSRSGAQSELGLLVRSSVTLEGHVEGSVWLLAEDGKVVLEASSELDGELLLPQDPTARRSESRPALNRSTIEKLSSKLQVVDRASARAISRGRRSVPSIDLPPMVPVRKAVGSRDLESVGKSDLSGVVSGVRNLVLRTATLRLAPGSYGSIDLDSSTLRLGSPGRVSRYDLQALKLEGSSVLELDGPTLLLVSAGVRIHGRVGMPGRPQWLDLRNGTGDVIIGPGSEVHAFISAPTSLIEVGPGASFFGGACSDRAQVAHGARFVAITPNWSSPPTDTSGPLFIHKSLRAQARFLELRSELPSRFQVRLTYNEDAPELVIAEQFSASHRAAQLEETRAFFQAACTALDSTGFDTATITFFRAASRLGSNGEWLQLHLTRPQFEQTLWAITRDKDQRMAMKRIKESSLLLNLFMQRCLTITTGAWINR